MYRWPARGRGDEGCGATRRAGGSVEPMGPGALVPRASSRGGTSMHRGRTRASEASGHLGAGCAPGRGVGRPGPVAPSSSAAGARCGRGMGVRGVPCAGARRDTRGRWEWGVVVYTARAYPCSRCWCSCCQRDTYNTSARCHLAAYRHPLSARGACADSRTSSSAPSPNPSRRWRQAACPRRPSRSPSQWGR
jgi:hypothetical protein